jgi:hypothetical protein
MTVVSICWKVRDACRLWGKMALVWKILFNERLWATNGTLLQSMACLKSGSYFI